MLQQFHNNATENAASAGDPHTRIRVAENAASPVAINPVTRDAMIESVEERALKRRRAEVEVGVLELELKERKLEFQRKEREAEHEGRLLLLENCKKIIQFKESLENELPTISPDDLDTMNNISNQELNAMVKTGDPPGQMLTVAKVAQMYGFPQDPQTLREVDRLASDAYFRENGHRPARKGLRDFEVDDVGLCVSAVEMIMGITGKTIRKEVQDMISSLFKPTTAESKRKAAAALLSRCHVISGFDTATPLVTFHEGMQLVRLLPAKHVAHVLKHIDATFQGVEAGDPRIHDRVDENAASDATVNRVARDGLGLSPNAIIEDAEGRALKRRRVEVELGMLESELQKRRLENQRNELENQRHEQENRLVLLENCTKIIDFRNALCERKGMSDIDLQTMTSISNYELNAMAKAGNPLGHEMLTVTKVALMFGFPRDPKTLREVGRLASDAYLAEHGCRPAKPVGADPRYNECVYPPSALELIQKAFADHVETKKKAVEAEEGAAARANTQHSIDKWVSIRQ